MEGRSSDARRRTGSPHYLLNRHKLQGCCCFLLTDSVCNKEVCVRFSKHIFKKPASCHHRAQLETSFFSPLPIFSKSPRAPRTVRGTGTRDWSDRSRNARLWTTEVRSGSQRHSSCTVSFLWWWFFFCCLRIVRGEPKVPQAQFSSTAAQGGGGVGRGFWLGLLPLHLPIDR